MTNKEILEQVNKQTINVKIQEKEKEFILSKNFLFGALGIYNHTVIGITDYFAYIKRVENDCNYKEIYSRKDYSDDELIQCNYKILIHNKIELDKLNKLCSKIKEIYECYSILFIPTDENGILLEIIPPIPF